MPRSILKQSSSSSSDSYSTTSLAAALPYPPPPPQVHFPPPTSLTQTHYTHSGTHYDRAPIVVLPNDCALPERGCPGRTYDNSSGYKTPRPATLTSKCGRTPHPRAAEASADGRISRCNLVYPQNASSSSMMMLASTIRGPPPLVPDISSSESDESDGIVSPPPEYYVGGAGAAASIVSIASTSQEQLDKALAFLPHAPSSPKKDSQKRDKDRKRRSSSPRFKSEDGTRSFAASSLDGCLGGF